MMKLVRRKPVQTSGILFRQSLARHIDLAHFTRMFKSITGVAPGKYARVHETAN